MPTYKKNSNNVKNIKDLQGKDTKRVIDLEMVKEKTDFEKTGKELKVECHWMERKLVYVNVDAQVFPCCYFATRWFETMYSGHQIMTRSWERLVNHIPQMQEYVDRIDDFNVEKTPVTDIIKDPLFNEKLVESWKKYSTLPKQCRDHCSNARPKTGYFVNKSHLGNTQQQAKAGEFINKGKKDD